MTDPLPLAGTPAGRRIGLLLAFACTAWLFSLHISFAAHLYAQVPEGICVAPDRKALHPMLASPCAQLSTGADLHAGGRAEAFYAAGQYWQLSGGDPAKAEEAYLAAWKIYASHCELFWPQARWALHGGDTYIILSTFYGFDADGRENRCAYELGRRFNEDREHVHAVRFFTRAIAEGRELFTSYYLRGIEHSRSGDLGLARKDYNRALSIDPDSEEVARGLGEIEEMMAD